MSKEEELIRITDALEALDHDALLALQSALRNRLKDYKPMRIKHRYTTCGKKGCMCRHGPDYKHGPFLVVSYREAGRTRTEGLGRIFGEQELEKMRQAKMPAWYDFAVSQKEFNSMGERYQWDIPERSLSDVEFQEFYGISQEEDRIGRPRKLRYNSQKYIQASSLAGQLADVSSSRWAEFGVGTWHGLTILNDLERQSFFLQG